MSLFSLALCSLLLPTHTSQAGLPSESDYYEVDFLTPPTGELLEVGGLGFFSDGRLAISTRRGQVWIVEDPMAEDPADAKFTLFAEGLFEGLGLNIVDDELYVLQRTELSRLRDVDGDGVCDEIDCITNDWGYSGNYHEFAFGLPRDEQGNFYLSLNVGFMNPEWWHGKSVVPDRGWVMKVAPDGTTTPFAMGMRSPCGLGLNAEGDLFYSDNQGDWMAVCPIFHVKPGKFYGHPASLNWTPEYLESQTVASDTIPPARERENAACWIPYDWSRSTGNFLPDDTGGKFGPFADQLIVAELTNGQILRTSFEKVGGEYQGAVFPMLHDVGSAVRVCFAPDGSLFTGLTNRGWGGLSPADGIGRIRWTGKTPLEMRDVRLTEDGFEVDFTLPLDPATLPKAEDLTLFDYDYDYWWEYGSPVRDHHDLQVEVGALSADGKTLSFRCADLAAGRVMRARISGLVATDGTPLLHDEFAYTINRLPGQPEPELRVVKTVPPPPARSSGQEGWLRMTYGDALDAWDSTGWELCDAELDPQDPKRFRITKGVNALTNTASETPSEYVSKQEFGDVQVRLAFMLPEGGNSGVYLMGRYEVQLKDSSGVRAPGPGDCGGIYAGLTWPGSAPSRNAFNHPGQWHELDITFRAPRFGPDGQKVENARFERVAIDEVVVQKDVELPEATRGSWPGEVARGPIRIQGDHGPVGLGNIRLRPLDEAGEPESWLSLLPQEEELPGWEVIGGEGWSLDDDVLLGRGETSLLVSERDDLRNFELRARLKISEGGRSALVLRASRGEGSVEGYELPINSSFADPAKTGTVTGLATLKTQLIPPDTWFDLRARCADEPEGTHLQVWINGILFTDVLDEERRWDGGALALEQHHEGSVIEVSRLEVELLP